MPSTQHYGSSVVQVKKKRISPIHGVKKIAKDSKMVKQIITTNTFQTDCDKLQLFKILILILK